MRFSAALVNYYYYNNARTGKIRRRSLITSDDEGFSGAQIIKVNEHLHSCFHRPMVHPFAGRRFRLPRVPLNRRHRCCCYRPLPSPRSSRS